MNVITGLLLKKYPHKLLNLQVVQTNKLRSYAQLRKRFYKNTGILYSNGKYEVTLDQRKLKTPKGNLFLVNSEPLALAVATEWDSQKDKIVQTSMHLTTLCNTAIDNPNNLTKYDMVQYIINYLETDTVLFQSDEDELYKFQVLEWDPIIQWFCDKFAVNIQKSRAMEGPKVSDETKQSISRHLLSYNQDSMFGKVIKMKVIIMSNMVLLNIPTQNKIATLIKEDEDCLLLCGDIALQCGKPIFLECDPGFTYAVDTLKSVILTLACVENHITPEKAVLLSRLEEEFQLGHWGRVEWAHDLDQQELQARLSAAVLYIYCNSSVYLRKIKGTAQF